MSAEPYVGEIMLFAWDYCPEGWLFCEGQSLSVVQYQALYAAIGATYGGDGRITFKLPDLRERFIVQQGQAPNLSMRMVGSTGGVASQLLSLATMPQHTHSIQAVVQKGDSSDPSGKKLGNYNKIGAENLPYSMKEIVSEPMSSAAISMTGGGQPVENMPPYLVLRYAIAYEGIFPVRA